MIRAILTGRFPLASLYMAGMKPRALGPIYRGKDSPPINRAMRHGVTSLSSAVAREALQSPHAESVIL